MPTYIPRHYCAKFDDGHEYHFLEFMSTYRAGSKGNRESAIKEARYRAGSIANRWEFIKAWKD